MTMRGMKIIGGILCFFSLALWFPWFLPWINLRVLEYQVKSNLDATELQQWAMCLIAKYPSEINSHEFYDPTYCNSTNLPSGLWKIYLFSDYMDIYTDHRSVAIFGSGKGGPFLKVGAPSLPAPTNQPFIQWKPGIYFVD